MLQLDTELTASAAKPDSDQSARVKSGALAVAGTAGLLASACCTAPLVLASIGIGGAAAGIVAMFEPFRPVLVAVALAALAYAGWKIYRRPVAACEPVAGCGPAPAGGVYKAVFWIVAAVVLALVASPYYIPLLY